MDAGIYHNIGNLYQRLSRSFVVNHR